MFRFEGSTSRSVDPIPTFKVTESRRFFTQLRRVSKPPSPFVTHHPHPGEGGILRVSRPLQVYRVTQVSPTQPRGVGETDRGAGDFYFPRVPVPRRVKSDRGCSDR